MNSTPMLLGEAVLYVLHCERKGVFIWFISTHINSMGSQIAILQNFLKYFLAIRHSIFL